MQKRQKDGLEKRKKFKILDEEKDLLEKFKSGKIEKDSPEYEAVYALLEDIKS